MTAKREPDIIQGQGYEMLGPIWNAVREFVEMKKAGRVVLHFDESGKLRQIESTKTQKL